MIPIVFRMEFAAIGNDFIAIFHLNEKKKMGKKGGGGSQILGCMYTRGGGSFDAYSVQQGWWGGGGLKIWEKGVCN